MDPRARSVSALAVLAECVDTPVTAALIEMICWMLKRTALQGSSSS